MRKIASIVSIIVVICVVVPVRAGDCPDHVNERMYDALQQLTAAQGSGDRKVLCGAVQRILSEARTAVSVGCKDYSRVIDQYKRTAEKNCEPFGY
jgi:hypothetical protein